LRADFLSLGADAGRTFDVIFEHTCFCAIDPGLRGKYVETVARLLKPGGKLIAIFFLNPDHDGEGPPHGVTRGDLEKLFGAAFALEREWISARTFPGREERELMRVLRKKTA
jgi:SAM-dependent methyltransferase